MSNQPNYYITGGFGFIGSSLVSFLNARGIIPYVIQSIDRIGNQWKNLAGEDFIMYNADGDGFFGKQNDFLIHLGANVDTTEPFNGELWQNNVESSVNLFKRFSGKIIYASSFSVYGLSDKCDESRWDWEPLNGYAFTKYQLDKRVFCRTDLCHRINDICALRFSNVYGNGEQYKGNMSSVIFKWLNDKKIGELTGECGEDKNKLSLFKSLNPSYADGEQMRDFIHVSDICKVIWHATQGANFHPGIFNLGSGQSTTWNTVAKNVLRVKGLSDSLIEYVDMPENLRNQYQYRTCADLTKLREVLGYKEQMTSIEEGIELTWKEMNK